MNQAAKNLPHNPGPWLIFTTDGQETKFVKFTEFDSEIEKQKAEAARHTDGTWTVFEVTMVKAAAASELLDMLAVAVNYFDKNGIDGQDLHVHEMRAAIAKTKVRA